MEGGGHPSDWQREVGGGGPGDSQSEEVHCIVKGTSRGNFADGAQMKLDGWGFISLFIFESWNRVPR